jgi:hypothetical protein
LAEKAPAKGVHRVGTWQVGDHNGHRVRRDLLLQHPGKKCDALSDGNQQLIEAGRNGLLVNRAGNAGQGQDVLLQLAHRGLGRLRIEDEGLAGKLLHRNFAAPRQRMRKRQQRAQRRLEQRFLVDAGIFGFRHGVAEKQVERAVRNAAGDAVPAVVVQLEMQGRLLQDQAVQIGPQQPRQHRAAQPDAQAAHGIVFDGADLLQRLLIVLHDRLGAAEKAAPFVCQYDAVRVPVQQAHAERFFQPVQVCGEQGGGNAQFRGRLAEAEPAREEHEFVQPFDLHGRHL